MSEKEDKKKLRGFPGVIWNQLKPLNENDEFKEKFKNTDTKILLNMVDGRYAALISIKNGSIDVEGIKNKNKEDLKKDKLNWDGKLETTTELLLKLATGELSTLSTIGKIISRKLKIKGIRKVLALTDIFGYLG